MATSATTDKSAILELTGILAKTDTYNRLRLCFVDTLEGESRPDLSWSRLCSAVPDREAEEYNVPYKINPGGRPDDAGIRGECWVTLPRARDRQRRILDFAEELRGKEVILTVRPKRYSLVSRAEHNSGTEVAGTALEFVGLEERPRAKKA